MNPAPLPSLGLGASAAIFQLSPGPLPHLALLGGMSSTVPGTFYPGPLPHLAMLEGFSAAAPPAPPEVSIDSFALSVSDLLIGYTLTYGGFGMVLTASIRRDGVPITGLTTTDVSGVYRIVDPGAGVYELTALRAEDSAGSDTALYSGATITILGGGPVVDPEPEVPVTPPDPPVTSGWVESNDVGALWVDASDAPGTWTLQ